MEPIYLDNNATTQLDDDVLRAMTDCYRQRLVNPASQHEAGRAARRILETARERISERMGLTKHDLCLFTSGGTEANNLAIFGMLPPGLPNLPSGQVNVVCSRIEHPSVYAAIEHLQQMGVEVRWIQPDSSGTVSAEDFGAQINQHTRLVVCMAGNNETGVRQPIEAIADLCQLRGVPFHVDMVQVIGKEKLDLGIKGVTSITISAHKFHGPVGIGALLLRPEVKLMPVFHGGFQQGGIRPGTENPALAAGFCTALEKALADLDANRSKMAALRDRFEQRISQAIRDVVIHGQTADRLPHTSNISFLGVDRQRFILAADRYRLSVSTGSACSSGSSQPSHVLKAMDLPSEQVESAIRFGFCAQNSISGVDSAVERVTQICQQARA